MTAGVSDTTGIAMKKLFVCVLLNLTIGAGALHAERPLRVVTTIPDLAAIAAAVGGDQVVTRSIARGDEDPHFLQARPAFVVAARDADLWIRAGLELEVGWEPVLLQSARNPGIRPGAPGFLDISEHLPVRLGVLSGRVTRAQGDVHPGGNPHTLTDPLNARAAARAIARKLAELRPNSAEGFERAAEAFVRRVDESAFGAAALQQATGMELWARLDEGTLDDWLRARGIEPAGWSARLRPRRGTPLVTYHKSFTYFCHRFGLREAAMLEPVPGVPPNPAHLMRLAEQMKAEGIQLILIEPFHPRKPADFLAERTGARVAIVAAYAPDTSPDGWFRMMDALVAAVADQ